jgi:hypothetical protein
VLGKRAKDKTKRLRNKERQKNTKNKQKTGTNEQESYEKRYTDTQETSNTKFRVICDLQLDENMKNIGSSKQTRLFLVTSTNSSAKIGHALFV